VQSFVGVRRQLGGQVGERRVHRLGADHAAGDEPGGSPACRSLRDGRRVPTTSNRLPGVGASPDRFPGSCERGAASWLAQQRAVNGGTASPLCSPRARVVEPDVSGAQVRPRDPHGPQPRGSWRCRAVWAGTGRYCGTILFDTPRKTPAGKRLRSAGPSHADCCIATRASMTPSSSS
jgi:hypothetical protein